MPTDFVGNLQGSKLCLRISVISIISMEGVLDSKVFHGTVDGDDVQFYNEVLTTSSKPFDGNNSYSVVILDNASINHAPKVITAIEDMGAIPFHLIHLTTIP